MLPQKALLFLVQLEFVLISSQLIPQKSKQVFNYKNQIYIHDIEKNTQSFVHKIEGILSITSVWSLENSQILHFELDNFRLSTKTNFNDHRFTTQSINSSFIFSQKHDFYIILENNFIKNLLVKSSNDTSLINFQRGIASLFQFYYKTDGITTENDVLGQCYMLYKAVSPIKYKKNKKSCSNWHLKVHSRNEKPLDVNINSIQEIDYYFNEEQNLNKVESTEKHSMNVAAKTDVGNQIESIISISYLSSSTVNIEQIKADNIRDAIDSIREGYEQIDLEAEIHGNFYIEKINLKSLVKSVQPNLTDDKIGTQEMASVLLKLLPISRTTNKKDFVQILKARSTQNIRNALLDLLAMTQTEDSHQAVMEIIQIENNEHFNQLERYFQTLAVGTRPKFSIIKDLFKRLIDENNIIIIDNMKLLDTIIQTLSANCAKYAKLSANGFNEPIIMKLKEIIFLKLKSCDTVECSGIYIRGLHNLQDPSTIPNLFEIILTNNETLNSVLAMKALKSFPINFFNNDKNRLNLEKIFYQISKKFDSTIRILALDIILEMEQTKEQLRNLITYLASNDKAFEIKTYVIQKISITSEKCPKFSTLINDILAEKPEVNNYHIRAQKGITTVLFRRLSKCPAFNETLYSSQESYKGVLKQGTVDIMIEANNDEASIFKLGLYTRGLSSFIGDSSLNNVKDDFDDDGNKEPENPSAGMEIAVQGVQFRPLVFFSTQGELMGHIWSGTASDPTPAYQATTLLQDHEEYLILQNGMAIHIRILGAQSIDLNGQITFSLWNRNGHAEINRNTGIVIDGSITLAASFIREQHKFLVSDEPKINLIVDCDFYSDIMMCLQLSRPQSEMKHKIYKKRTIFEGTNYENIESFNNNFIYKLSGKTLAINRKNNQMCNKIFL